MISMKDCAIIIPIKTDPQKTKALGTQFILKNLTKKKKHLLEKNKLKATKAEKPLKN